MKNRILTNWTVRRALYLALGVYVIVQSIIDKQWLLIVFGAYFAAMGLLAIGCASGNCAVEPSQNSKVQDVEYEEIKTK